MKRLSTTDSIEITEKDLIDLVKKTYPDSFASDANTAVAYEVTFTTNSGKTHFVPKDFSDGVLKI